MIVLFMAQQVIMGRDYRKVPDAIKPQVAEILRESGAEHLIIE